MVKSDTAVRAKKIFCVVAYDIKNDRHRSCASKILEKYGVRVNYSVFECMFTRLQFVKIQEMLQKQIKDKDDSIIFYPICVNCFTKIEHYPKRRKASSKIQIV